MFQGTVTERGVTADAFSRSYEVKLRVDDADASLLPGMVGEVSLTGKEGHTAYVLPPHIVQLDETNCTFVWVASEGRAEKRRVVCGDYTADGVIVDEGLKEGDQVIVEGQQKVCVKELKSACKPYGKEETQFRRMGHALPANRHPRGDLPRGLRHIQPAPDAQERVSGLHRATGYCRGGGTGQHGAGDGRASDQAIEDYIFTYKEVKKEKTFSKSRDGITYIQVELNDDLTNKDEFWSKFKHGVSQFKSELPSNVLALVVQDDFGDTVGPAHHPGRRRQDLPRTGRLHGPAPGPPARIPSVGRMSVSGMQYEQISVYLDHDRLSKYGLSEQTLALNLMQKGFTTSGEGRVKDGTTVAPIYVSRSLNTVYDVQQQIVYTDRKGRIVRLKDVARVVREYPEPDSYITNNGRKCLLLSVEMKKGQNIVAMGEDINRVLDAFQRDELPSEVTLFRITDQPKVVDDSVSNFLHELLIAIVAVVIVVMLLLPLRVALVAASTIPITIFISLGLFYAFGIELNTVTLAGLIVTLGMIVDNSIVIIDSYLEKLGEGCSRWRASIESTTHFLKSIFSATLAISITFFPFLATCTGMIHDFLLHFPRGITIVLAVSLLVATMLVPFMQFWFIRKPMQAKGNKGGKKAFNFLDLLQKYYNRVFDVCFRHPYVTVGIGAASILIGGWMMGRLPQQLLPAADRDQFAVEISLPTGTDVKVTAAVADSLEHILRKDPRVVSVASFKGCSSPRFQTSYAPQIAGTNYAQFIVNTTGVKETVELLDEYAPRYEDFFPKARVRFKQLSYSDAVYPVGSAPLGRRPGNAERRRTAGRKSCCRKCRA